ncbi:MAG TPA: hypothetical protein VNA20_03425 [Frankiaceae bacterium]|nr:hypothetical protein [Frankiaceae bacterium]
MVTKLALTTLAVSALAFSAPAAQADAPTYDCRYVASQEDTITGSTYQGVLVGYIVHADPSAVSIRCYVTVNGVPQSGADTGTGSGTTFATAQRDIEFTAGDTDIVRVCAQYTSSHVSGTTCAFYAPTRVPRVWPVVDPPLCAVLMEVPIGGTIGSDGDVYVGGKRVYDCPPYAA